MTKTLLRADREVHGAADGGMASGCAGVPVRQVAALPTPGRRRARRRRGGRRASSRSESAWWKYEAPGSSVTGSLPALMRSGSIASPAAGAGPMPSMPFSVCRMISRSAGRWSATRVGRPMPRFTYEPSGCRARRAARARAARRAARAFADCSWPRPPMNSPVAEPGAFADGDDLVDVDARGSRPPPGRAAPSSTTECDLGDGRGSAAAAMIGPEVAGGLAVHEVAPAGRRGAP